jgi:hypothetical protein
MRVKIEHTEQNVGGLLPAFLGKKSYVINVAVQFSEAERAIVKARNLYKNWVDISPGILASSVVDIHPIAVGIIRSLGRFAMVGGFILGLAYYNNLGGLIFFVGVAMEIYGWYYERKLNKGEKDTVTIKDLLSGPISIRAANPAHAKTVDDHVRASLVSLKGFIEESETLALKDTFEL